MAQQEEIPMQATQSSPTPQRNDTDEESDLEKFKEILPEDITVAIFCALSYESVAVKYSLDEEFECRPKTIGPRRYVYSFGRIGDHKVVIARPHKMGTVKAAQCAATVCQQFPNVRFALMVGIGAGIPSLPKHDIRLGDIAVSNPHENHPGVIQYDFGKYESDGTFILKGSLDKPPPILVSADGSLEEDEMMNRTPLKKILRNITKQPRYVRPSGGDILFDATFQHVNKGGDCGECEASSEKKIVFRAKREPGQPTVHRGLILSGSGVVKNPEDRDRLRRAHDGALCYEMEAAGIMDEIPCLVVRGICDYADTHKQDGWHHYAAAVAAAYSKAILLKVYGHDVEETTSMKETMDKLSKKFTVIKRQALATEHDTVLEWLTTIDYSPDQNYYHSRQQHGTGQWFLDSAQFQAWLKTDKQTLFCPGIPGSGKTFITSIVIDYLQTNYENSNVAYLYCKVNQQDQQTLEGLLGSTLKQLVRKQFPLPKIVVDLYDQHKAKQSRPELTEISTVLRSIISLGSRSFIIIDALDECQNHLGCRDDFLEQIFTLQTNARVNIFATSRPEEVQTKFSKSIVREIIATDEDMKTYLDDQISQETVKEVEDALKDLAKGENKLDEAYEQSMKRVTSQEPSRIRHAIETLKWLFHAKRQLNVEELLDALAIEPSQSTLNKRYRLGVRRLLSMCAGLVRLDEKSETIDLIHKTTRDYFDRTKETWFPDAESNITTLCVTYLSFDEFKSGFCQTNDEFEERLRSNPFYHYAANNWGLHAREALEEVIRFLKCNTKVEGSSQAMLARKRVAKHIRGAHLTAYFGLDAIMKTLLEDGIDVESKDSFRRTPLSWAAGNGHEAVVELLLATGKVETPLSWAAENGHEAVVELLQPNTR
ncbi:purine and uridine phosphorylase [Mytilinidion resinicola]|uniref:Purine and uridine phosphorylase n=1 Tax=Mytilinidion resinicola TaxID=574789 RepID=A0A6A6YE56_9PEZI|nr:purine and uridine phosphorylase [Mytilinidion resinicola]KAF2807096.1 purine and uridine phosphorylase [Mytilinidion resinicola]